MKKYFTTFVNILGISFIAHKAAQVSSNSENRFPLFTPLKNAFFLGFNGLERTPHMLH